MEIGGLDKRTEGDLLLSAPKGVKILWYDQVVHYLEKYIGKLIMGNLSKSKKVLGTILL